MDFCGERHALIKPFTTYRIVFLCMRLTWLQQYLFYAFLRTHVQYEIKDELNHSEV
jgi:hypothetical protein